MVKKVVINRRSKKKSITINERANKAGGIGICCAPCPAEKLYFILERSISYVWWNIRDRSRTSEEQIFIFTASCSFLTISGSLAARRQILTLTRMSRPTNLATKKLFFAGFGMLCIDKLRSRLRPLPCWTLQTSLLRSTLVSTPVL